MELFQHAEMEEQQVILTINSNNETSVIVQTSSANVNAAAQENGNVFSLSLILFQRISIRLISLYEVIYGGLLLLFLF